MTQVTNCNHGALSWVSGNDVWLKVRVFEKYLDQQEKVQERAYDLTACDEVTASLSTALSGKTDIEYAIDHTEDNCLVLHLPYTLRTGQDTQRRGNAQRAIDAAKKTGVQTLDYVVGGVPVTLTTDDADMKLAQLEMYAVTCAAVTERHKATIANLLTAEAVEEYDYTVGYPQKLVFTL